MDLVGFVSAINHSGEKISRVVDRGGRYPHCLGGWKFSKYLNICVLITDSTTLMKMDMRGGKEEAFILFLEQAVFGMIIGSLERGLYFMKYAIYEFEWVSSEEHAFRRSAGMSDLMFSC